LPTFHTAEEVLEFLRNDHVWNHFVEAIPQKLRGCEMHGFVPKNWQTCCISFI
jgi:hypothetical protein